MGNQLKDLVNRSRQSFLYSEVTRIELGTTIKFGQRREFFEIGYILGCTFDAQYIIMNPPAHGFDLYSICHAW